MRRLFHFAGSPFSRRARLALAYKGLDVELCDARANPAFRDEAHRLTPLRTFPVLLEADGGVIGDSNAISLYLDRAYPTAPLWPSDPAAALASFNVATLVDVALNTLVDVGTRYYALRNDPAWAAVRDERMARAQGAVDGLLPLAAMLPEAWCAPHIWLFTLVAWMDALPARAAQSAPVAQVLSLGLTIPQDLRSWAEPHEARADVKSLG